MVAYSLLPTLSIVSVKKKMFTMLRLISSWSTKLLNLSQFACRLLPRRTNRLYLQHSHCVSGLPENTRWCIWLHDPTLPEFRKQGSSFFFLSEQPPPLNSASTFISSCCSVLKYHWRGHSHVVQLCSQTDLSLSILENDFVRLSRGTVWIPDSDSFSLWVLKAFLPPPHPSTD